jgi:hypothetical protein
MNTGEKIHEEENEALKRELESSPQKKEAMVCTIESRDVEALGFKMEPRDKSTDPFIFYKAIMIDPSPDRNWEDHGYFVRLILLYPEGTCIIHVLDPSDRYKVVKKSKEFHQDREAKLPCHFHGTLFNKYELERIIEMSFLRDEMFDFNPQIPEPHQNFWVDLVIKLNNQPAIN